MPQDRGDPIDRTVTYGGTGVDPSPREYDLVRTLAKDPTRVMTKPDLRRAIWGDALAGLAARCGR